jgi:hypothetical protein
MGVAVSLSLLALLVPIVTVAIPTFTDYPNHLARIWLLSGGINIPPVSTMYRLVWDTPTNIGIDVLSVVLTKVLSYRVVGSFVVILSVMLPVLGGVLTWRAIQGRWHWWQVAFSLLAWSMGVILGFLNFEIGIGLALLGAALEPRLARHGIAIRAMVRFCVAAVLLTTHVFAVPFYATLLGAIEFGPVFHGRLRTMPCLLGSVLLMVVTVVAPIILVTVLSKQVPGTQSAESLRHILMDFQFGFSSFASDPLAKLRGLAAGVRAYSPLIDLPTLGALAFPIIWALLTRRLVVHAGMLLGAGILAACYFVCPAALAGAAFIDMRFSLMLAFVVVLAFRPDLPSPNAGLAASLLLAVSLIRTGNVAWALQLQQTDVRAVLRALEPVPPGASVLPLQHLVHGAGGSLGRYGSTGIASFNHLGTLALPWRHAFVPTLFAARGKQPIEVLPPWSDTIEPDGGLLESVDLLDRTDAENDDVPWAGYIRCWRSRFDFALVLNADMPDDAGPFLPPPGVTLVRDEGFAQLYRIQRETLAIPCTSEQTRLQGGRR